MFNNNFNNSISTEKKEKRNNSQQPHSISDYYSIPTRNYSNYRIGEDQYNSQTNYQSINMDSSKLDDNHAYEQDTIKKMNKQSSMPRVHPFIKNKGKKCSTSFQNDQINQVLNNSPLISQNTVKYQNGNDILLQSTDLNNIMVQNLRLKLDEEKKQNECLEAKIIQLKQIQQKQNEQIIDQEKQIKEQMLLHQEMITSYNIEINKLKQIQNDQKTNNGQNNNNNGILLDDSSQTLVQLKEQELRLLQNKYNDQDLVKQQMQQYIIQLKKQVSSLMKTNQELKQELIDWKQKYSNLNKEIEILPNYKIELKYQNQKRNDLEKRINELIELNKQNITNSVELEIIKKKYNDQSIQKELLQKEILQLKQEQMLVQQNRLLSQSENLEDFNEVKNIKCCIQEIQEQKQQNNIINDEQDNLEQQEQQNENKNQNVNLENKQQLDFQQINDNNLTQQQTIIDLQLKINELDIKIKDFEQEISKYVQENETLKIDIHQKNTLINLLENKILQVQTELQQQECVQQNESIDSNQDKSMKQKQEENEQNEPEQYVWNYQVSQQQLDYQEKNIRIDSQNNLEEDSNNNLYQENIQLKIKLREIIQKMDQCKHHIQYQNDQISQFDNEINRQIDFSSGETFAEKMQMLSEITSLKEREKLLMKGSENLQLIYLNLREEYDNLSEQDKLNKEQIQFYQIKLSEIQEKYSHLKQQCKSISQNLNKLSLNSSLELISEQIEPDYTNREGCEENNNNNNNNNNMNLNGQEEGDDDNLDSIIKELHQQINSNENKITVLHSQLLNQKQIYNYKQQEINELVKHIQLIKEMHSNEKEGWKVKNQEIQQNTNQNEIKIEQTNPQDSQIRYLKQIVKNGRDEIEKLYDVLKKRKEEYEKLEQQYDQKCQEYEKLNQNYNQAIINEETLQKETKRINQQLEELNLEKAKYQQQADRYFLEVVKKNKEIIENNELTNIIKAKYEEALLNVEKLESKINLNTDQNCFNQ